MSLRRTVATVACAFVPMVAYAQDLKGDAAKGQPIVAQVCAACHGPDGNSVIAANPKLAAQHPEYTLKQLANFKPGEGKPAVRPSPIMSGMVANLSTEDMANLAAYFAAQAPRQGAAADADLVKRGQDIYRGGIQSKGVAACAACHLPNGAGMPAQYPRLAGQHAQYVEVELKAFRSGVRTNDPNGMMRAIAGKLSDAEIKAVAEYISGLH